MPSVPLVDRDVATAGGIEWPPVPAAMAFAQPQAGLSGHQVQFARPGVAQGHRPQVRAVPVESDHLGDDALLRRIVLTSATFRI